jgi:hypothetical protein
LPVLGEKIGVFLKNQCCDPLKKNSSCSFIKKTPIFFHPFLAKMIFKILTSVPGDRDGVREPVRIRRAGEAVEGEGGGAEQGRVGRRVRKNFHQVRESAPSWNVKVEMSKKLEVLNSFDTY